MSVGFAGSKGMDDRRRRRLATENDEVTSSNETSSPKKKPNAQPDDSNLPSSRMKNRRHFPLRKIISHRKWKIGSLVLLTMIFSTLVVLSGFYSEWVAFNLGEGINTFVNPLSGQLAINASGCLLLFSGQLALLIWWVRSHSIGDFEGRFRIWPYAGMAMLVAAFSILTGAHHAFSATIRFLFQVSFWKQSVICWLAPSSAVTFSLLLGLRKDMRDCKSSHFLLWLSALGGAVAAFLSLEIKLPEAIQQPALVQMSLMLISAATLFSSMLLHTRYVIHDSAEAPQKRMSLFAIILKRLFREDRPLQETTQPKTTQPKKTQPKKTQPKKTQSKKTQSKKTTATKKKKPANKRTSQKKESTTVTPKKETVLQKRISQPKAKPAKVTTPEPTSMPKKKPVETDVETIKFQPIDPDSLKGLSKKERRKLRKQAREEQRNSRRAA